MQSSEEQQPHPSHCLKRVQFAVLASLPMAETNEFANLE